MSRDIAERRRGGQAGRSAGPVAHEPRCVGLGCWRRRRRGRTQIHESDDGVRGFEAQGLFHDRIVSRSAGAPHRAEAERIFANYPEKLASFAAKGSVLVGDVHPDVARTAGAFTPVPGGVGPLTIAMLMSNTVRAARQRRGNGLGENASRVVEV